MILSSRSIRQRIDTLSDKGGLIIEPYTAECQQPASYDLRADGDYVLKQGGMTLIASMEWVELPVDLAATLRCRSSFARRGIHISGGFVDPGFRGHLTLCLLNMGTDILSLQKGERIIQMILHEVSDGDHSYEGRYQDSIGVVTAR
jgi:dCTP deaminase